MNGVTPMTFGRSTCAPAASSACSASLSCMIAARSSGLAPVVSRSSTKRWLLPPRPGRWKFSCAFTSTPEAINAVTSCMPVVVFERGCGSPVRGRYVFMSTAM